MRNIEFSELKLKNISDEETFYQFYLKNRQEKIQENKVFQEPIKQYEIFHLNILEGKIILLNKDYIENSDTSNQDVFYNYSIAYKAYNLMSDIEDGIEDEKNEMNELYKEERLRKETEITELKRQDEELFEDDLEKYNIIINSEIYKEYLKLQEENKRLKIENEQLTQKAKIADTNNKVSFFQKIVNRWNNKKLPM